MFYIGIDLGTSAVKLLLMDRDGKIVNIVSRNIPCIFPVRAGLNRNRRTGTNRPCWV